MNENYLVVYMLVDPVQPFCETTAWTWIKMLYWLFQETRDYKYAMLNDGVTLNT